MPSGRTPRTVAALIASIVATAPVAAERPWSEIRGRNVIVFGQQSPRTVRDVAIQIEQFRAVVGRLIAGARQPQSMPTEVYLFDSERAMRDYVPLYQGRPAPLAGYCHCGAPDEISVIVASLSNYRESSAIIYHEYTHLLTRNALPDVPVWLNEGLAEYFSTFTLHANGREAEIGAPIPGHVTTLHGDFIPLSRLLAVDRNSPLYNERSRKTIFYAEAWALTHYLLVGRPSGLETLNAFLAAYAGGADSAPALERATGLPLSTIERNLRDYVSRPLNLAVATDLGPAMAQTLTLSEPVEVEAPSAVRTLTPPEAEARLGEVQLRIGREEEAAKRIEAAAAAGPTTAQAQLVLARLRLRQERNADAVPLLQKASALAPNDFDAQFLYALTLLRGDGDLADASWPTDRARAAREVLLRAVAIRADSATALAWLGYADQQEGTRLTEARDVTQKAIALAPGRLDYALQLAEIESQLGETAGARQLLVPLARASDESIAHRAAQLRASLNRPSKPAAVNADPPRETLDLRHVSYRLREPRPGEQRVFGELVEIACGASGVRFRLRVDGRDMAAPARRMEDVELTTFGPAGQTVMCGPRVPVDPVYLTRAADGTAVAVEFMPKDYVP